MIRIFKLFLMSVAVAVTLTTGVPDLRGNRLNLDTAQWSIGQPGTREPPQGLNRYVYLVMSDPLPGREFDFNDGYQNMHMGDLVQLPGWTGAQRFRLVPDVMPRNIQPLYRRGNLIIWDQEGTDLAKLRGDANAAIAGGKSRRIPGFDYSPDGPVSTTYQVIAARTIRSDGRKPFIPDYADNKTPRPNRYATLCLTLSSRLPASAIALSKRRFRGTSSKCWHCRALWRRSRSTSPRRLRAPPRRVSPSRNIW